MGERSADSQADAGQDEHGVPRSLSCGTPTAASSIPTSRAATTIRSLLKAAAIPTAAPVDCPISSQEYAAGRRSTVTLSLMVDAQRSKTAGRPSEATPAMRRDRK